MAISDYSTTRDNNASIAPGDLRSNDYRRDQQIINAIRQLMADLAAPTFEAPIDVVNSSGVLLIRLSTDNNGAIEIGKVDGTTSTPYIDFHSGATFVDYDSRIIASGGSGVSGGGSLQFATADAYFSGGRIRFPAAQNASSDANTLDDYEEGSWTPAFTFVTPGDLNVVFSVLGASYVKIGKQCTVWMLASTSTFTHTTAAGEFRITGLPFTAAGSSRISGSLEFQGFNWPGGATQVTSAIPASTAYIRVIATGSGLSRVAIQASDHPSGTNGVVVTTLTYEVA